MNHEKLQKPDTQFMRKQQNLCLYIINMPEGDKRNSEEEPKRCGISDIAIFLPNTSYIITLHLLSANSNLRCFLQTIYPNDF